MEFLPRHSPDRNARDSYQGSPFFALAFRPFYFLAAVFGAIAIGLWVAIYLGLPMDHSYLMPAGAMLWHAHEMVFGFAAAILVGFLYTAGKSWTGVQTPQGNLLFCLTLLWAVARVLMWTGPSLPAALVDSVFLPVCALLFLRVLQRGANRRNYGLAGALMGLGLLNVLFHAAVLLGQPLAALQSTEAAIGLFMVFVTVVGGRVIPIFTRNAIPDASVTHVAWIERIIVPLTLLAVTAFALQWHAQFVALLALLSACAHSIRLLGWQPQVTWRKPILAILHLAYAWLPVGFVLMTASFYGWTTRSTALHALTVGVIGCAVLAMMTRTALAHTGRALVAGKLEVFAYGAIASAAAVRVFGPALLPSLSVLWIAAAGALWVLAFLLYLVRYLPYLTRRRVDGKAG